jgi:cytoskeletal protein CcmA (bactofilin family)
MKLKTAFLLLVCILFGLAVAAPVHAFEIMEGNEAKDITVAKDTVVKGSLLAAGNSVTVDGTVNGDLYCAGQTIIIRGTITGDVLCAGQTLDISGTVGGNIRSFGQILTIAASVKRNVVVAGQTVSIAPEAVITGELLAAGQTIHLNSFIGGDVNVAAQSVSLGEKAQIVGNFTYTSPKVVDEATGAAVAGKVSHLLPKKGVTKPFITSNNWMIQAKQWPQNILGSIIFFYIVGAFVIWVAREKVVRITKQLLSRPLFDGLVGLFTLVVAPIIIVMVAITIIGIPVAIILAVCLVVMIILSRVYVAFAVGNKLSGAFGSEDMNLFIQLMIGVIVTEIVYKVPVLGWIVSGLTLFWGLGGLVINFGKRKTTK